jgi:DNA mismatch repair protein MutS2
VGPFGREAKIESIEGERVTVLVGGARFQVRLADCLPPEDGPAAPEPRWKSASRAAVRFDSDRKPSASELNLIGVTVEEGIDRLDKFLDDAFLTGHAEVRIIHGHGSGRLRNAERKALASHPQVASHRPGEPHEGGDGATVATLTI